MVWVWFGNSWADVGQASLVAGTPEFTDCLDDSACASNFFSFLTHSMMEQGFVIQSHNVVGSRLVQEQKGWYTGVSLSTFPFHPPQKNLSGKEENTSFSPVFPRFHVGHIQEDSSCGLSVLPPVPVRGASALFLSFDYDKILHQTEKTKRTIAFDLSLAHIRAPITASDEQFSDRDSFENPDNLNPDTFAERCGEGCLDQFSLSHLSVRFGQSWGRNTVIRPYLQGGLSVLSQWLYVMYDDTLWNILSVQPSLHSGVGWQAHEHLLLVLGGSTAVQFPMQNREGTWGGFYTLDLQAAYHF